MASAAVTPVAGKPALLLGAYDLAPLGYQAEEFFLSGSAAGYALAGPPTPDGAWSAAARLWTDHREDNILDGGAPFYRTYETADHKYIAVGAIEQKFYDLLLERLGLARGPDMQPQSGWSKWPTQGAKIAAAVATRTRDDWCALLEGEDVCVTPVLSIGRPPITRISQPARPLPTSAA